MQFDMARDTKLPIVIKYRKAGNDICDALWKHKDKYTTGVVSSISLILIFIISVRATASVRDFQC